MSGILGAFGTEVNPIFRASFDHALSLLHHRGPDGSQTWTGDRVILGQTHLAKLNPEVDEIHPLVDRSSRYRIVLDGEIYNNTELREVLEKRGAVFQTRSDAEVILEAYKCWGGECQAHFNGVWAFVIHDQRQHELFFSRDRYGVRPAYHANLDGMFLFASEIKPLLTLGVDSEPDWSEVNRFLQEWSGGTSGNTPFKKIRELPAGHCLKVSAAGQELVRWWKISENLVEVPKLFHQRVDYFKSLFEDACRLRLQNVDSAGMTLSGGMDSGSIYGAVQQVSALKKNSTEQAKGKNFRTFTISYPGNVLDEYEWVDQDLRFWSDETPPGVILPSVKSFPDTVDDVIRYQELPRWSLSVMIYHQLYQYIASTGTKVVLEGHGGDELLGGYRDEIRQAVHTYAARGNFLRAWQASLCLRDMLRLVPGEPSLQAWKIFIQGMRGANLRPVTGSPARFRARRDGKDPLYSLRMKYFRPVIAEAAPAFHPEIITGFSPYIQALYFQFTQRLLPTMIQVFDRAAMVHSVGSRLPFLDHRIVQYAFSIPDEDKVGRRSKVILRRAAIDWLPETVISRRVKTGYNTPEKEWLKSPVIHNYLRDIFNSRDALQSELIDGKQVASDLESVGKDGFTRRDASRLWRVFNIYKWNKILVEPFRR